MSDERKYVDIKALPVIPIQPLSEEARATIRENFEKAMAGNMPLLILEEAEVRPVTDWVGDLEELHKKFGDKPGLVRALPTEVKKAYLRFRLEFIEEELDEMLEGFRDGSPEEIVDGMIDICVVAIGTLHAFGVDVREAWRRVQVANMAKVPGPNPKRANPFGLPDLVKPEGWKAPDHTGNHGFLPEAFSH